MYCNLFTQFSGFGALGFQATHNLEHAPHGEVDGQQSALAPGLLYEPTLDSPPSPGAECPAQSNGPCFLWDSRELLSSDRV